MCDHTEPASLDCQYADLYLLGAGPREELAAFEAHLRECARCQMHINAGAVTLGKLAPMAAPRAQVRAALIAAIRSSTAERSPLVFQAPGVVAKRPGKMPWAPADIPGVSVKRLFEDPKRGQHTTLVCLAAGAKYPAHRHAAVEEVFVLEGDLHMDVGVIVAGDYCRAEPGSVHSVSHSVGGCVLLVNSSTADELLGM